MTTSPTGNRVGGWTLIELIVAIAILSFGLAGIMATLGKVLDGANQVALSAQAGSYAQRALAEMELQGWTLGSSQPVSGNAGRFHWQSQIAADKENPIELWTSTVTWPVRGKENSFEVSRVWYRMRSQS